MTVVGREVVEAFAVHVVDALHLGQQQGSDAVEGDVGMVHRLAVVRVVGCLGGGEVEQVHVAVALMGVPHGGVGIVDSGFTPATHHHDAHHRQAQY